MKIIFLGPPGAGKGTQAALISERYKIPTISTGNIIRNEISLQTKLGKEAEVFIKKGELVPDDVVIGIIKERLSCDDCKNGFILDGFPRTVAQAQALIEMDIRMDAVLDLVVRDEDIVRRMSGRLYCQKCGATYHSLYNPPVKENLCDQCSTELSVRDDDKESVVMDRLRVYHAQTKPLEQFYTERGKLYSIDGSKKIELITADIINILDKLDGKANV